MHPAIQYLVELCIQFHGHYPIGSFVVTGFAVTVPVLYYLYNRHLQRCTFHMEEWGSIEIEKGVRCNKKIVDGKLAEFLDDTTQGLKGKDMVKTLYQAFMHGLAISPNRPFLGRLVDNLTKYEWLTYAQARREGELIGKFLRSCGFPRQTCMGIYASNCPEWVIAELGCMFQSMVTVPLYETLGIDSIRHTINEVEMPVIFCDSVEKLKRILAERSTFPNLKIFVLLHDKVEDPTFGDKCKEQGIEFFTWKLAKFHGADYDGKIEDDPPKPDDMFLIQYTSGTTGLAKGVIMTHANMIAYIAGADGCARIIAKNGVRVLTTDDVNFLYMPLAHAYGQCSVVWFWYIGARIGFSSGNVQRLPLDAQILKPTYFPLVPRIMNRVYTKVLDETMHGFKGWLFWKCYERKRALFRKGIYTRNSIYDWLVFGKLQNMLGGRIAFMTTGSAPIAPEVLEFWRVVFGAIVVEAFGQTETTAIVTCAVDVDGGNVGHPDLACLVRLLDLPELGYTIDHNPPRGEICVKGPIVTSGYYKRPQQTKDAFTPDGWLLTGDIGEFLPDGSLKVIDRKKHIFKLAQGEYVAPEKIESTYAQCPLVAQVYIDGDSLQTYVVAIVVPDEKEAMDWANENGLDHATMADLCANKDFQQFVLNKMIAVGKQKRLNGLEQIKAVYLHPEAFSIDNGLLTPSMKNKRNDLRKRFKGEMEALYKTGPMIATSRD